MIKTVIIDDEPSAVNVLSLLLKKKCRDDVEIIATANSADEGKLLIEQHQPDLVFLDIEMPGMTGIDLIRSCKDIDFRLVFVTAHDAYAVEAFELCAMDYLLKPVGADKVVRVVQKIKADIAKNQNPLRAQLHQFERILKQQVTGQEKIAVSTSDKIIFIKVADIIYCEAKGAYTNIFLNDGKNIFTSRTLGDYESQLSGQNFFRIHHSTLINLHRVQEFQRFDGGYVVMENKVKLEVSMRKRRDFLEALNEMML
jgi:two-component system LytT family response regulator